MEIRDGISIHVAERIITGRNYVSSVEGSSFSVMEPEKRKRADFRGEYSILGAMIKSSSKERRQLYKEMLHKFFESEVSIPNLSEQIDADGVLNLINTVDEDLWLQIVSMLLALLLLRLLAVWNIAIQPFFLQIPQVWTAEVPVIHAHLCSLGQTSKVLLGAFLSNVISKNYSRIMVHGYL